MNFTQLYFTKLDGPSLGEFEEKAYMTPLDHLDVVNSAALNDQFLNLATLWHGGSFIK